MSLSGGRAAKMRRGAIKKSTFCTKEKRLDRLKDAELFTDPCRVRPSACSGCAAIISPVFFYLGWDDTDAVHRSEAAGRQHPGSVSISSRVFPPQTPLSPRRPTDRLLLPLLPESEWFLTGEAAPPSPRSALSPVRTWTSHTPAPQHRGCVQVPPQSSDFSEFTNVFFINKR